jgi:hypothetical protein
VVSDLLGHAQVWFTLSTYFHPDEDAAVDAIAHAEQILGWAVIRLQSTSRMYSTKRWPRGVI